MNRLVCLDGLRGLLAVYVTASHMAPFAVLPPWLQSLLSHGGAAVDMFFMLSGLVIVRSLAGLSWRGWPFLINRAVRIFPAYLPVLGLAIAVQPLATGFEAMPWLAPDSPARAIWSEGWPPSWAVEILAHVTMLHGLFPDGILPNAWVSFLGAAWSLSTEWQFYVLMLLAGIAQPAGRRLDSLVAGFLALGAAGIAWQALTPDGWHFSRAFLPNKGQYFALGIASAQLLAGSTWRRYGVVLAAALALSGFGGFGKALPLLAWSACLAAQRGVPGWRLLRLVLQTRILVWLGAISYGLYLVNEPVQKLLGVALARAAEGDGATFTLLWCPLSLLVPVAVAVPLHAWVELPALRRGRAIVGARGGRPAPVDALGEAR